MCLAENKGSLQRGMNYHLGGDYSVILMSVQANAPYKDSIQDYGRVLIYEGHNHPRSQGVEPKLVDQPRYLSSGRLTENGKFFDEAKNFSEGGGEAHRVKVYEKLKKGIWADNGYFDLIDTWVESDGRRKVFKFKIRISNNQQNQETNQIVFMYFQIYL